MGSSSPPRRFVPTCRQLKILSVSAANSRAPSPRPWHWRTVQNFNLPVRPSGWLQLWPSVNCHNWRNTTLRYISLSCRFSKTGNIPYFIFKRKNWSVQTHLQTVMEHDHTQSTWIQTKNGTHSRNKDHHLSYHRCHHHHYSSNKRHQLYHITTT
jgi:hypothetical protein